MGFVIQTRETQAKWSTFFVTLGHQLLAADIALIDPGSSVG